MALFGGIESGGTKWVCAVGTGPDDLRGEVRFPTVSPGETLERAIQFFAPYQEAGQLASIGISSFGPIDLHPASPTFGYITSTPKPGWAHTDVVGPIWQALDVPVGFDTDTNGAALAEYRWGAAQGLDTFLYLTIGTGIGGGGVVNGELIHGLVHPEMGHIRIPHDWERDPYPGFCPFHGDCLEGLAAGPALEGRWEQRAETLPADHPAWPLEAEYLALSLVTFICTLSPQRIIMGGGVMEQPLLFPLIRQRVQELLNEYIKATSILEQIDDYIVPPGLGSQSGVLGGIALAQLAVQDENG